MRESKKEELLSLFVIVLALAACSAMVYMLRTPSLTGSVVLESGSTTTAIIAILILVGIMILIGALITIHRLRQEMDQHKKLIVEKSLLGENPDLGLAKYVTAAKTKGFAEEQIIGRLEKSGWKEKEIRKYM